MVLKSLRFCNEGEVDAYHFPQESSFTLDLSESEYGEDNTIAPELNPLPTSVSEFEDSEIDITTQEDDLKLEDEADGGKLERWTDYSEPEDVKICTSPQQSISALDDEAFSAESPELFTINECDEEVENAQSNDEPDRPEPQQLSPIHQSYLEFDND